RFSRDWSSDVCSSDLPDVVRVVGEVRAVGEELLDGRGSEGTGEARADGEAGSGFEQGRDRRGNGTECPLPNRHHGIARPDGREVGRRDSRMVVSAAELDPERIELELLVEEGC